MLFFHKHKNVFFTSTIVLDFSLFINIFFCLFYFHLINIAVFTSAFLLLFYFRHKDLEDSHDRRYFAARKDVRLTNLLPVTWLCAGCSTTWGVPAGVVRRRATHVIIYSVKGLSTRQCYRHFHLVSCSDEQR